MRDGMAAMRNMERLGMVAAVALVLAVIAGPGASAAPGARTDAKAQDLSYFTRLQSRVEQWRDAMPAVRRSADAAAARMVDGGALYFAGPQKSLIHEAWGRSGGPMFGHGLKDDQVLHEGDTVIAGALGGASSDQTIVALAKRVDAAGAHLIVFGNTAVDSSARLDRLPAEPFVASAQAAASKKAKGQVPITSVSNVVGLWAWMGEFVHGCVNRGKMPYMYESFGIPGGKERAGVYHKQGNFHKVCRVKPEAAARLSGQYLDAVEAALAATAKQTKAFERAGALLRAAHAGGQDVRVTSDDSHMFPYEPKLPATPSWFKVVKPEAVEVEPGSVVIDLGYQGFPWQIADKVKQSGGVAIITSSQSPPPWFEQHGKAVHLNPHWAIADAAVDLPGYDIPILPISGVMQWSIYWQLVELSG